MQLGTTHMLEGITCTVAWRQVITWNRPHKEDWIAGGSTRHAQIHSQLGYNVLLGINILARSWIGGSEIGKCHRNLHLSAQIIDLTQVPRHQGITLASPRWQPATEMWIQEMEMNTGQTLRRGLDPEVQSGLKDIKPGLSLLWSFFTPVQTIALVDRLLNRIDLTARKCYLPTFSILLCGSATLNGWNDTQKAQILV